MKKQIMLGGLLLLLGSCTPQNKANDPNAIDIAVSPEHLTELKTSQLGKQIRYIPLETTDSSLIGNSYSIKLSKDHIFVSTNGRCLSFNKQTGKYLGSIGHKGEDPQGYSNANCFIHPHTNNLYFYRQPDKLVKYDTKGNYLGQVHLPQKISPSLYFTFSDSLILAHYGEGIGQPQASALLYFNEQGEVKDSLPEFANPGDPMGMDRISSINVFKQLPGNANIGGLIYINYQDGTMTVLPIDQPSLWLNNGSIHFRKAFNDTIYDIKGHEATVHTTFHTGQWHFPAEKMGQKEDTDNYIVITGIRKLPNISSLYLYRDYTTRENPSTVFTTKKNILLI
ncbi:DUF4934 domain-containing protein [Phocaeicola vulgatus]|nr:DUF4934 domain-containing protein [Phocaeicola vulgatus]